MPNVLNLHFRQKFKIINKCLRFMQIHPDLAHDREWVLKLILIVLILLANLFNLCFTIICHDIKLGLFGELCKNSSIIIVFISITSKIVSMLVFRDSIIKMILFVDNDYTDSYSAEEKEIVLKYVENGADVCKYWFIVGFGTLLTFPLHAFILMAYYGFIGDFKYVSMFELSYPEPIESKKNDLVVFCLLFLLAFAFDVLTAVIHIGFDTLCPIFMLHVCGQLILLKRRMLVLFTELEDPKEIQAQLNTMIIKLQSLYKFINRIKNFSILYEFTMKTSTVLLPLTTFQIIEELRDGKVNTEFMLLTVAGIIHFYLPCYYSDVLMTESENFRQAIYSSGWEKCPDKGVRQTILFMLTRARIPMGMKTVFYMINLDTFAEMVRQSYGILSLMNAAWG